MDNTTKQTTRKSHPKKSATELIFKGEEGIFRVRKGLKTHFRILYIAMVFTGMALVWYGIWKGVQAIPVLSNPIVAIVVGLLLLSLTGRVNKLE